MCETPETAKAYIAGFIDGEGSICISGVKRWGYVQIQINQMNRKPLDFINKYYPGRLIKLRVPQNSYSKHCHIYRLIYHEANVRKLLRDMESKLILKSRHAKLALQFIAFKNSKPKKSYTLQDHKILRAFKKKMHQLNGHYVN